MNAGASYSFSCSKKSHAMLDPYWLGGMARHVKRIDVRHVMIMRNDPVSAAFAKLSPDDALHILEGGYPAGPQGGKQEPFYNPHLLIKTDDRMEKQKSMFGRLLQSAQAYQLNAGTATLTEMVKHVLGVIGK